MDELRSAIKEKTDRSVEKMDRSVDKMLRAMDSPFTAAVLECLVRDTVSFLPHYFQRSSKRMVHEVFNLIHRQLRSTK